MPLTAIFSSYGKGVLEFVSWSSFRQVMSSQNTSSIGLFYKSVGMLWRVPEYEELVWEFNHTTECVTDHFS